MFSPTSHLQTTLELRQKSFCKQCEPTPASDSGQMEQCRHSQKCSEQACKLEEEPSPGGAAGAWGGPGWCLSCGTSDPQSPPSVSAKHSWEPERAGATWERRPGFIWLDTQLQARPGAAGVPSQVAIGSSLCLSSAL